MPASERRTVAERVIETAERLERDIAARPPPVPAPRAGALRVQREGDAAREVAKARYVVGRGAHCDLVIESAKISREHAALVREPDGWWIEDLGSSNGTWFRGERISRRPIADGDEYFLCSERLRCELR
jgi:pSer/pThr/pTyr-binding forkhead associated (FHA) protein